MAQRKIKYLHYYMRNLRNLREPFSEIFPLIFAEKTADGAEKIYLRYYLRNPRNLREPLRIYFPQKGAGFYHGGTDYMEDHGAFSAFLRVPLCPQCPPWFFDDGSTGTALVLVCNEDTRAWHL